MKTKIFAFGAMLALSLTACGRTAEEGSVLSDVVPQGSPAIRVYDSARQIYVDDAKVLGYGEAKSLFHSPTTRLTAEERAECAGALGVAPDQIFQFEESPRRIPNNWKAIAFKVAGIASAADLQIEGENGASLRGVCIVNKGERNYLRLRFNLPVKFGYILGEGKTNRVITRHYKGTPSYSYRFSKGEGSSITRIWLETPCASRKVGGWSVECRDLNGQGF